MSGVAAIVNTNGERASRELIVNMASLMAIRGPERQQYWCDDNIAMAHTLLLTSPNSLNESQPSSLDGKIWISADVRIDGREELVSRLKAYQCEIDALTSDEKLVLFAYQIWGVDCLKYLIGDFAFTLWDSSKQRLFCATDQFGVVPLYYASTSQGLCVSNTLNAIRLHPDISNELDELAVADYLLFRINQNPNGTFFKHISHLPAGHFLIFEDGKVQSERYWSIAEKCDIHHAKPKQYVEEFEHLFKLAVADRSCSDSVSVHLSGGMDSSSVAALSNVLMHERKMPRRVVAYTYGASGNLPDLESPIAQEIAQHYGMEHHILQEASNSLNSATAPDDLRSPEPRFTTRDTSNYHLLRHAASHSSVLLSGFGGDPLLQASRVNWGSVNTPSKFFSILRQFQHHWSLYQTRPPLGLQQKRKWREAQQSISERQIPSWINQQFAQEHMLEERMRAVLTENIIPFNAQSSMTNGGLWRRVFCWNDPGFTHIPIKVRHPFFDTRLLKYAQTLPPTPWLYNKTILRQSMHNLLPKSVLMRPKTPLPGNGLQATLSKNSESPTRYNALLENNLLEKYIDLEQIKSTLNTTKPSNRADFKAIIRAVTLSDWLAGYQIAPVIRRMKGDNTHVTRIKHR